MAVTYGDVRIPSTRMNIIINSNEKFDNFVCKLSNILSNGGYYMFYPGHVKRFEQNNEFVYLWVDAKGNACYSPSLLDKEYITTTPTRIGNALSSHLQVSIEVVNNRNEYLRKKTIATMGLNKALSDSQRYDENTAYANHSFQGEILGEISMNENTNKQVSALLEDVGMSENINQQMLQHQPVVHQQQYLQKPIYDQKQLNKEIVGLTANQLEYNEQTHYLSINELIRVNKEEFKPEAKEAFPIENGLTERNSYISTKYMIEILSNHDINNSFVLSYIFSMAKDNPAQAWNILIWFANAFNLLKKLPFILVLHSENDIYMRLFYEEIIVPLFNPDHCEKIENDNLDKKSLATKLDKMVINNFHNVLTPTILKAPTKELTKRLIHKDNHKLNNKIITTKANIIVTSTSKYIPIIAKDVPSLVVEVESSLEGFCKEKKIPSDYYAVAKLIEDDLPNFASIIRNIDLNRLNNMSSINYYDGSNSIGIMDSDVDVLKVFESSIKNRDKVFFKIMENISPELYLDLVADFDEDRVNRKNIIWYFSSVFGQGIYKTNRALITALRHLSTTEEPFENEKLSQSGKTVYYNLY